MFIFTGKIRTSNNNQGEIINDSDPWSCLETYT